MVTIDPSIAGTTTPPTSVPDPSTVTASTDAINTQIASLEKLGYHVQRNTDYLNEYQTQMVSSQSNLKLLSALTDQTSGAFKSFTGIIDQSLSDLNQKASLTTGQMMKLGGAFTFLGAVGNPFEQIGKSDNLTTFSSQVSGMIKVMDDNAITKFASSMGIKFPVGIKLAGDALKNFVVNMTTNADSAVQMEDMYVRASAATGQLGQVHQDAGDQLEKMNGLIANQREMMEKAADATNLSSAQMAKFYQQISLVPGALKQMNADEKEAIGGTDILTATVRLARGTGMEYADVVNEMHQAIREYSASVPEAMKFTANISQISQQYGVELKDVQDQLLATASAFKYFGAGATGAAEVMNQYVGALKGTGLSGAVASDIVGNMTKQIGNLTLAQKAFISAQQGGPGGLQGAFNIDNILRQKDGLQKVFEMTKNQMTKMMGPLVTTKEAAESPQAAAQLTKQIMMLKSGPLGQFARTDQEAERIIEAFKSGKSADYKDLAKDMSAPLDKGLDYQKQTATGISQMLRLMQHGAGLAAGGAINTLQAGTTAGAGVEFGAANMKATREMRDDLSNFMEVQGTADTDQGGVTLMKDANTLLKNVPGLTVSAIKGISSALTPAGQQTEEEPTAQSFQDQAAARNNAMTAAIMSPQKDAFGQDINTGADQMRAAVHSNVNRQTTATGSPHGMDAHPQMGVAQHVSAGGNEMGEITVHIEGMCINCGEKMHGSTQRAAVSPASKS
jgi:hypothetical protein